MDFTPEDVKRLYGSYLFILPDGGTEATSVLASQAEAPAQEDATPASPEPAPISKPDPARFTQGSSIDWKMKTNANLALVLTAEEFANRELTALLKQAVLDAGVNVARIGFGIYDGSAESWDFAAMPVAVAVVCGGCAEALSEPLTVADKQLFPAPLLQTASRHPEQQAQLALVLRQAREQLG